MPIQTLSISQPALTNEPDNDLHHFAELGRLSASLLHEISNPLATALLELEQLDPTANPRIKKALICVQSLRRYVEAARLQACKQSKSTVFKLRPQVCHMKRIVIPIAKRHGIFLSIEPAPICQLYGDPVKFQQILTNLIVNAIESYDETESPHSVKAVKLQMSVNNRYLMIKVRDWGKGIAPDNIEQIFKTHYSTKPSGSNSGLGLGLSIVQSIVINDFGGSITVKSQERRGSAFTIRLPNFCERVKQLI